MAINVEILHFIIKIPEKIYYVWTYHYPTNQIIVEGGLNLRVENNDVCILGSQCDWFLDFKETCVNVE